MPRRMTYCMHTYHFIPVINKQTRFSSQNNIPPSLFDHIWLQSSTHFFTGIIMLDLTDYLPIYLLKQQLT